MQRTILMTMLVLFSVISLYAQDTTYIDSKSVYNLNYTDSIAFKTYQLKNLYPHYSGELIKYSNDSFVIEHCLYLNGKRDCNSYKEHYQLIGDSSLIINGKKYLYKQTDNGLYQIKDVNSPYIEVGYTKTLVPFKKNGNYTVYTPLKTHCVTLNYLNNRIISYSVPYVILDDTIYSILEKMPEFPGGNMNLLKFIQSHLEFPPEYAESCISGTILIRFVVTKTGEIKNVEVKRGFDLLLEIEAIKIVSILPRFNPGILNGNPVNTYFRLPIRFRLE